MKYELVHKWSFKRFYFYMLSILTDENRIRVDAVT